MAPLAVVILAAGLGKRMKSSLPKVVTTTIDKPLIIHVLSSLGTLSPERVIIVTGHKREVVEQTVRDALASKSIPQMNISFAFQETLLGTGDAVKYALPQLKGFIGTVLITCGDAPLIAPDTFASLIKQHHDRKATITMLSTVLDQAGSYGRVLRNASGDLVEGIIEAKDCTPEQLAIREINAGVYAVDSSFLSPALQKLTNNNHQQEYYLTDIVGQAASEGQRVCAILSANSNEILGVNSFSDLNKANVSIMEARLASFMAEGVEFIDPRTTYIGEHVRIGAGTRIGPNTQLLGTTQLGGCVTVEGSCFLLNATVGDGATLKFSVRAESSSIGSGCSVGPFAHLRPGTELGSKVKIGNFVETKNAHLSDGVSAGHLSYLGDCDIGQFSNIGAGTITCNYDGVTKHKTIIGDNAFVGSDTILIAPVELGNNSVTGAGSVITKQIPPNSLGISRPELYIKENYKRRQKK
jgi:bifunctional UDP-N-acetylglucosamine pyrophosphorylase/glucosamine-1-phosphate N-acetyltransferase